MNYGFIVCKHKHIVNNKLRIYDEWTQMRKIRKSTTDYGYPKISNSWAGLEYQNYSYETLFPPPLAVASYRCNQSNKTKLTSQALPPLSYFSAHYSPITPLPEGLGNFSTPTFFTPGNKLIPTIAFNCSRLISWYSCPSGPSELTSR